MNFHLNLIPCLRHQTLVIHGRKSKLDASCFLFDLLFLILIWARNQQTTCFHMMSFVVTLNFLQGTLWQFNTAMERSTIFHGKNSLLLRLGHGFEFANCKRLPGRVSQGISRFQDPNFPGGMKLKTSGHGFTNLGILWVKNPSLLRCSPKKELQFFYGGFQTDSDLIYKIPLFDS